jgi:hypothetical protein
MCYWRNKILTALKQKPCETKAMRPPRLLNLRGKYQGSTLCQLGAAATCLRIVCQLEETSASECADGTGAQDNGANQQIPWDARISWSYRKTDAQAERRIQTTQT